MALKALLLAAMIAPAVADDQVGMFMLEREHPTNEVLVEHDIRTLKERAARAARKAATYLNTHPIVGNPNIDQEYRDILPHEAFGRLKDSFKSLMREKFREHETLTKTNL